jgi:hypothetical protein
MFQYFSQGSTPSIHHGYVGYVGWSDMAKLLNEALPALFEGPVAQQAGHKPIVGTGSFRNIS